MIGKLQQVLLLFSILFTFQNYAQNMNPIEGRWDLVIDKDNSKLPSWLEIRHSGINTFVGRFVYAFGSARPISEIKLSNNKFSFEIPPQWEEGKSNMIFEGALTGGKLSGSMIYTDGKKYLWKGVRAPLLNENKKVIWGAPKKLFNKKNTNGWHIEGGESQFEVVDGILKNKKKGGNLISDEKFTDFKLHLEFKYPKGSNSGVYLRGRYEVQIADNFGLLPSDIYFGGVYGFLEPNENAAKKHDEWQEFDITLIGRRVMIIANGKTIINDQVIPGITGGALDSNEGEAGPIMIQGDHGPFQFRKIEITPIND